MISCWTRNDQEISVGVYRFGCTPPGTSLRRRRNGAWRSGSCETGHVRKAVGRIERRVLIGAVAERVLQIVVHSEAGANDRLAACCRTGSRPVPARGCGRNFALFTVNAEAADVRLRIDDAVGERVGGGAAIDFIPAGGEFVAESERQRSSSGVSRIDVLGIQARRTSDRQPSGVGVGSYSSVATVPCRNVCRLVKVACPYWLSASISFDCSRWNQAPTVN